MESLRSIFCNPFVEANMPAMFARNIPDLKDQQICPFLTNLDAQEEISQEDYRSTTSKISKLIAGLSLGMGGMGLYGVSGMIAEAVSCFYEAGIAFKILGAVNLLTLPLCGVIAAGFVFSFGFFMSHLGHWDGGPNYNLHKLAERVNTKIHFIIKQMSTECESSEWQQLEIAKNFFFKELSILQNLANLPKAQLGYTSYIPPTATTTSFSTGMHGQMQIVQVQNPHAYLINSCPKAYAGAKSAFDV